MLAEDFAEQGGGCRNPDGFRVNFLLKSEPQRFRTSTGSFIFVRFYAAFLAALINIYLD